MTVLERLVLAIVIGFCVVLSIQALDIKPPARTFPLFASCFTGAMAAVALARSFFRPPKDTNNPAAGGKHVLVGATGLIAYGLAMSVSYVAATVVFLFLGYVFLMPNRTLSGVITAACTTVVTTGFTWLCFSYWLGVNLR